ncbi:MAG TPA: Atxe2 family lasso peptide isopeptidase [Allosphingosinicella sp.]
MVRAAFCAAALAASLCGTGAAAASAEACRDLEPPAAPAGERRPIEAADLIRLRDIGGMDARLVGESPIGVSPDGRRIAFHLRRASLAADDYCQGIFVLDVRPGARPRQVASGGELILDTFELAGLEQFPAGTPRIIVPRWSPDGQSIAWLKRQGGVTRVWRVPAAGGPASPLTGGALDVEDFGWMGPDAIIIATRPGLLEQAAAAERERDGGWLYDRRFFPFAEAEPYPVTPIPTLYSVVTLSSGAVRAATPAEEKVILGRPSGMSSNALLSASEPSGRAEAWTEPSDRDRWESLTVLRARVDGRRIECGSAACQGKVQALWWLDRATLLFLRSEGVNRGTVAFYRWRPGQGAPQALLRTADRFIGCQLHAAWQLVCAREGATMPRRLVLLDARSGKVRTLLDLNPEFGRISLAPVRRLTFRNAFGIWTYGDLVLPPDHHPGETHPLVVTQYLSQGFLRGGTGDEVPIQLLARRGYAVLSFQRPYDEPVKFTGRTVDEFYRSYSENWIGRRNIASSLEAGVRAVIALGVAGPERVGVTGFSDGASTATFALINMKLFAAASLSICCDEPAVVQGAAGPGYEAMVRTSGYKRWGEPGFEEFWKPQALLMNASRVSVPLLIQASDREFRMATGTYSALVAAGQPVEMHVFADEAHVKVRPRHRLAIYARNVDWFDYWLRGVRDPAPGKAEQYRRWDALPRPGRGGAEGAGSPRVSPSSPPTPPPPQTPAAGESPGR